MSQVSTGHPAEADARRGTGIGLAVSLLTILPARVGAADTDAIARSTMWFPLVGAAVGAAAGLARAGTEPYIGALPASVLGVVVLLVVTGAIHVDGLADTADGLGVRGDRTRRLAAMRDSSVGAFGVLALVSWALLMTTTVGSMSNRHAFDAFVTAAALGRWAAVAQAPLAPPARLDGLGAGFSTTTLQLVIASVFALLVAGTGAGVLAGAWASATALIVAIGVAVAARHLIGGRTGDTLGAAVSLGEVGACIALLAVWGPAA
jgi:adenosylcobinamide-GDP ribazoletransferase